MLPDDFGELNKTLEVKANPSNQNFHHRMIQAFAKHHIVTVISYRPIPTYGKPSFLPYVWKKTKRGNYHYLAIYNRKYAKQKHILDDGVKLIGKLIKATKNGQPLIVVDAINGTLRRLATKSAAKYNLKTLAIVTDNPKLLSGVKPTAAANAIKEMRSFDYYLPLTPALDIMANPRHKKHINVLGIAEDRIHYPSYPHPYLFFCGALHERYGINNLITAFISTDYDVNLLIAGHGPERYVSSMCSKDRRIKFLGQLDQAQIYSYEAGAIANINPRPYDKLLDQYSVPSKFFEYMTSGAPTISTEHSLLMQKYEKLAIWAGQGTPHELKHALGQLMNMAPAMKERMAKKAKEAVLEEFGIEAIGTALAQFTSSLK